MAKKATAVNSKGEEGKVLEDVSTGETNAGVVPAVGAEKKKKNQNVDIAYYTDAGEERTQIAGDIRKLVISVRGETHEVKIDELSDDVIYAAAVFGLNTALRNTYNSNANADKDGKDALLRRLESIRAGKWAAESEGERAESGTPLVLEAIFAVAERAGKRSEEMEAKFLAHWRGLDAKGRTAQQAAWLKDARVDAEYLRIKASRAAEKAAKAAEKASSGESVLEF